MTIPELIRQGVTHITDPSWNHGHLEIRHDDNKKIWFMLIVDNETGKRYLLERGDKAYYLQYDNYEEYIE